MTKRIDPFKVLKSLKDKERAKKAGKVHYATAKKPDTDLERIIARHQRLARMFAEVKKHYAEFDELTEMLLEHTSAVAKNGGTVVDNFQPVGKTESNKAWKSVCFMRYQIQWR